MRMRMAIICAVTAVSAQAQERVAPGPSGGVSTKALSVSNKRDVELRQFEVFVSAPENRKQKIIGKLPRPLGAGESVDLPIEKAKGCVFHARWSFVDAEDSGEVDLCSGKHIVLVD